MSFVFYFLSVWNTWLPYTCDPVTHVPSLIHKGDHNCNSIMWLKLKELSFIYSVMRRQPCYKAQTICSFLGAAAAFAYIKWQNKACALLPKSFCRSNYCDGNSLIRLLHFSKFFSPPELSKWQSVVFIHSFISLIIKSFTMTDTDDNSLWTIEQSNNSIRKVHFSVPFITFSQM